MDTILYFALHAALHCMLTNPPLLTFLIFRLGASSCAVVGRFGDFLYHMSMAFGNAVLLDRVATIVPAHLTKRFTIAHLIISFIRFAIGVVDTAIVTVNAASNGSCLYQDNIAVSDGPAENIPNTGPVVYTFINSYYSGAQCTHFMIH